jgi:hypothetical protein
MRPAMLKIDLGTMSASSAIDASRDGFVSWVLSAITPDGSAVTTETAAVGGVRLIRGRAGEEEPLAHGDGPALEWRSI